MVAIQSCQWIASSVDLEQMAADKDGSGMLGNSYSKIQKTNVCITFSFNVIKCFKKYRCSDVAKNAITFHNFPSPESIIHDKYHGCARIVNQKKRH